MEVCRCLAIPVFFYLGVFECSHERGLKDNPATRQPCKGSQKKRELTSRTFGVSFAGDNGLGVPVLRRSGVAQAIPLAYLFSKTEIVSSR